MISAPLRVSSAPKGATGFTTPSSSCSVSSRFTRIRCFAAAPATAPATAGRASTLYEELGVRAGATVREIKAAYRRLARERHPDVAGAADDFLRLHHAYATLSDPDSRARYDFMRAVGAGGGGGGGSHGAGGGGMRWSGRGGERPRRTWETDQCW